MTDLPPQGWFPDPMGRFEERWWDGATWSSRVRSGGQEGYDVPVAETEPRATAATPAADGRIASAIAGEPAKAGLERRLKRERPAARLAEAMSAAAGLLGVLGIFAFVFDSEGDGPAIAVSLLVVALGYALVILGPPIGRPAAVVAGVIGPLVFVLVATGDSFDGRAGTVIPALLLAAVWSAMFVGPGMRGAPVLVAGVLFAVWIALSTLAESAAPSASDVTFTFDDRSSSPLGEITDPISDVNPAGAAGSLTLVYALGLAVAAAVLDAKGWHTLATPFIAVAVVLSVVGLSTALTGAGDTASALIVVVVGAVLALVGGAGERRGSIWIGVALATGGLIALVAQAADEPEALGVLLLILAAAIIAAAGPVDAALRRRLARDVPPAGG